MKTSPLSNLHQISQAINAYYQPILDQLANVKSREEIIFKHLYSNKTDNSSNSPLLMPYDYPFESLSIEFDRDDKILNCFHLLKVGEKIEVNYLFKNEIFMKKTITTISFSKSSYESSMNFFVTEYYMNQTKFNQYELIIDLKRIEYGTFVFFKIKFHSSFLYEKIFKSDIQHSILTTLKINSFNLQYKCSYIASITEIIKGSREKILACLRRKNNWKNIQINIIKGKNPNMVTEVGEVYQIKNIPDSPINFFYEFDVIKFSHPDDNLLPWEIKSKLVKSDPPTKILYSREYKIDYISDNRSLITFQIQYDEPVDIETMNKSNSDSVIYIKGIKDWVEID